MHYGIVDPGPQQKAAARSVENGDGLADFAHSSVPTAAHSARVPLTHVLDVPVSSMATWLDVASQKCHAREGSRVCHSSCSDCRARHIYIYIDRYMLYIYI